MKLDIKKTIILSMAFFTITLAWTIYNNYIPTFLTNLGLSSTLIGVIMTFDNIFGIIFQPYFGTRSDSTSNRFGRRMPYILIGIPFAAVFFLLIPNHALFANKTASLIFLMVSVICMNFSMSIYRAPAVALMPDATPAPLRTRANGIVNIMGGIATILALSVGGLLFNLNKDYPIYPFAFGAVFMVIALVVLLKFHKEPKVPFSAEPESEKESKTGLFFGKNGSKSAIAQNPSLLFMLLTVFFWFCGFECVLSFFPKYCLEKYALSAGDAALMLAPNAVVYMLASYPGGILGNKLGRKTSMVLGNFLMLIGYCLIFILTDQKYLTFILGFSGIGWAFMSVNAYPSLAEMAPAGQTGRYTGYYFIFTLAASIASPILYGIVADLTNSNSWLFAYSGTMFTLAFICLLLVNKHATTRTPALKTVTESEGAI